MPESGGDPIQAVLSRGLNSHLLYGPAVELNFFWLDPQYLSWLRMGIQSTG